MLGLAVDMRSFLSLLGRFRSDERGAFLVIFGVMAIVLVATSGAVVDYTAIEQARTRAQQALDTAALGLQPTMYESGVTEAVLKTESENLLVQQLNASGGEGWSICDDQAIPPCARIDDVVPDLDAGTLHLEATVKISTAFVALIGFPTMEAKLVSEAARGSINVEVALALDTTGSMAGQRIIDLRAATEDFIQTVVKDVQTPAYSKVALVPYSMAVNVGNYAEDIRGAISGPTAITGAAWVSGSSRNISGVTKASPARVTTSGAHGFSTGDFVYISGVAGMTQLNNRIYRITVVSSTRFTLNGVNSSYYGSYQSGGTVRKCLTSLCEVVVTSAGHGLATGEYAYITGVGGMTQVNNRLFAVGSTTSNTFVLSGTTATGGTSYSTYTSGGSAYCVKVGCQYYLFRSPSGNWNLFQVSNCVTERTTDAYTDVKPSTTPLGRNYPSTNNPCSPRAIVPLSADKNALIAEARLLTAGGSTGGQIGVEWAWHMVSPEFAYLWPADSQAGSYEEEDILKIVVIMTDGEYNSVYCNGVISADSTSGSGSTSDHINCNAPNGNAYAQAEAQCAAMKAAGVIVYTVGFDIVNSQNATNLMANCATDAAHAYTAETGTELKDVFQEIAQNIGSLRVTK